MRKARGGGSSIVEIKLGKYLYVASRIGVLLFYYFRRYIVYVLLRAR